MRFKLKQQFVGMDNVTLAERLGVEYDPAGKIAPNTVFYAASDDGVPARVGVRLDDSEFSIFSASESSPYCQAALMIAEEVRVA